MYYSGPLLVARCKPSCLSVTIATSRLWSGASCDSYLESKPLRCLRVLRAIRSRCRNIELGIFNSSMRLKNRPRSIRGSRWRVTPIEALVLPIVCVAEKRRLTLCSLGISQSRSSVFDEGSNHRKARPLYAAIRSLGSGTSTQANTNS